MTDNISIQNRKAIGLNKGNEERMMMELKRRALEICDEDLFDFVKCTRKYSFGSAFLCRSELRKVNECTKQYTRTEDMDELRLKYLNRQVNE